MERPSHTVSTLFLQSRTRRVGGLSVAVIAQLSVAAVLIGGIVDRIAKEAPPPPLEVTKVDEKDRQPPPPPIKAQKAEMPTAAIPLIDIAPESSGPSITVVPPQPTQPPPSTQLTRQPPPPPALPDRAASAIIQTHTSPPYPTLARRLGVEGKVMLRLSVQADGSVAQAEVVTSSGRQDLDQAASQWIVAHWTYKPAIRNGVPAASQVLAAVQFSLSSSP
jgi:protein TonB